MEPHHIETLADHVKRFCVPATKRVALDRIGEILGQDPDADSNKIFSIIAARNGKKKSHCGRYAGSENKRNGCQPSTRPGRNYYG